MSNSAQLNLRRLLVGRYASLLDILSRRLGSTDLAGEALNETYLRLEKPRDLGNVRNPLAYLVRIALNIVNDARVLELRRATDTDEHAIQMAIDERPDPAHVAEVSSEWKALMRALESVPKRRRDIFLAAWAEEVPYDEIARRYGVGVRTIQIEVKRALEHCAAALKKC